MIQLKQIGLCLLVLALGWGGAEAQELKLEELIDEALANNPGLSALKHRWAAFERRVPQAGALEDPVFRFEASNLPLSDFGYDSTPMSGNQFVLSQMFPFPGTLAAKERAAGHASEAAEQTYLDREGFIVNKVKQAYFTLAFLDRAIEVTEKNETLLRDLVRIAQRKYSVGKGLQQDVLKAQVALSGLQDRLVQLKTKRRMAEARLNLVLNRSPQATVGAPGEVELTALPMSEEEVFRAAVENRPLLKAAGLTVEQWKASEEAARRQLWPNLSLSLGYRQRAFAPGDMVKGSDFLSFGVGLSLPIFQGRKQRQKIAEARASIRMAESQAEAATQEVLFHTRVIYLEIQQHREEADLFWTAILPQAEQALASAMSGYQVDKVDFLTLLHSQVTLFNYEIDFYRHVTEHEKQLAELEAVVGKRIVDKK